MRYIVKDENLRNLITALKVFHDEEFILLLYKWKHFEGPTVEENKRLKWLLGEKEAERIIKDAEMARYENRKRMRQCKTVEEYHEILQRDSPTEVQRWPTDSVFHYYKEEREKEKIQQEKREQERKKQSGKRWIKTRKIRGTKKELKDDIIKYDQFLRKKLEAQLESLPVNLENEGIDECRIVHGKTIERYPFLQGIIKKICPKAFEPPDEELQLAIKRYESEKEDYYHSMKYPLIISELQINTRKRKKKRVKR